MKGIEEILLNKKQIAVVFRKNIPIKGVKFLTKESNDFQVGIHQREKGVLLVPHIHKLNKSLVIKTIQEILFVVSGKIKVNLLTKDGKKISSKILNEGDSILFIDEGHGVEILEDARIFEIKQGPYPGVNHSKIYFPA